MTGANWTAGVDPFHEGHPGASFSPAEPEDAVRLPILSRQDMLGHDARRPHGLCLRAAETEAQRFDLVIVDREGAALQRLPSFHEDEVVAAWRRLAAASGLVLLVEDPDGAVQQILPQIGRLPVGPIRIRRRHQASGRRPRFLVRRKTARLSPRPLVHREREIASGTRG